MTHAVQLRLEGCTIVYWIQKRKGGYVYFDIELQFDDLRAVVPLIRDCSLSVSDIKRLAAYAESSLAEDRAVSHGPFAAYDAFFSIEFLEDDLVRFMVSYGPAHPLSVGVESTILASSVTMFRDGWLREASVEHQLE